MSDTPAQPAPRWRVLVTPRWISWHLFAVAALAGMTWLTDWQLRRALGGNTLSWAYTFEWPVFAVFGVVFWVKTVRDELTGVATNYAFAEEVDVPAGARRPAYLARGGGRDGEPAGTEQAGTEAEDTELAEYNAYLARLSKEVRGHGRWHGLR
jgi:hypothetical protein